MLYRVVGAQRFSGDKSKKTGKPYDVGVLHCVSIREESCDNQNSYSVGCFVDKIFCPPYIVCELPIPAIVDITFDRFGRFERVEDASYIEP